jgi:plasmid stabilization system protein ParE
VDLIFHPNAAQDARSVASHYAAISSGLEQRFWNELDLALDAIASFPSSQHYDPSDFRLKRFPYHVLFEERLGYLRVMVIRHHHRNPAYGLRRR